MWWIASRTGRRPGSIWYRCLKEAGKIPEAEAKMQEAATKVKPELQAFIRAECLQVLGRPRSGGHLP